MKKEYVTVVAIALFILSYVIDWLAGPIGISIRNPFHFLQQPIISTYPFTAVSVGLKAVVIIISILTLLSLIAEKQLAKGVFLVFLAALFELYSIQQIATGSGVVPLPWSLAFAFSGVFLLVPALIYVIIGLGRTLRRKISQELYGKVNKDTEEPDL